jgi:hypothetical protein
LPKFLHDIRGTKDNFLGIKIMAVSMMKQNLPSSGRAVVITNPRRGTKTK